MLIRYGGDVHIDDDENWSVNSTRGVRKYANDAKETKDENDANDKISNIDYLDYEINPGEPSNDGSTRDWAFSWAWPQ